MRTVRELKKSRRLAVKGKEGRRAASVSKEGGNAAPRLRSLQTLARQVS